MKKYIKAISFLGFAGIAALLIYSGSLLVARKKARLKQAPKVGRGLVPVQVTEAKKGDFFQTLRYLSVVQPYQTVNISSRILSRIDIIHYDEGDIVGQKKVLLQLDKREIQANFAGLGSQMEEVKANIEANTATIEALKKSYQYWKKEALRDKKLAKNGTISGSSSEATLVKADDIRGKLMTAQKKNRAFEKMIDVLERKKTAVKIQENYCTILSPFAGVVAKRYVDPGDLASPGKTLMTLEDRKTLKLSFDIPQTDLPLIKEKLQVMYFVHHKKKWAQLSHLYPSLDASHLLRGEIYLEGNLREGLQVGAYVSIRVVVHKFTKGVLLPLSVLIQSPDQRDYVFILVKNKLEARLVKVVGKNGNQVYVRGVKAGEKVLLYNFLGWARLSSGLKVEAIR